MGNGGALGFNDVNYAQVKNCSFINNEVGMQGYTGGNGGAINFYEVNILAHVVDCTFIGNWAENDGGAIGSENTCWLNV